MKKSELISLIENIVERKLQEVLKEDIRDHINSYVKKRVSVYTPIVAKEICEDIVNEIISSKPPKRGSSLNELYEQDDEWPTLTPSKIHDHASKVVREDSVDRHRLASMLGYGDTNTTGVGMDMMIDSSGNPVPINPSSVPDSVNKALNKDYSEVMKKILKK